MVPSAQRLIVTAPADRMAEIADLIALLDVDTEETTEVRIYPFPTGVNVQDLANTLSRLSGGQTVTRGKPAAKGQPKGRSRRPTPTGGPADVTFIAQPTQHRILVSARSRSSRRSRD